MSLFSFPEDARWNPDSDAVEFTVAVGDYVGTVRVGRDVLRRFLTVPVAPDACLQAYYELRTELERAAEAKLRRRELAADGNLDLTGRDLRPSR
jgi:hypothetical protein